MNWDYRLRINTIQLSRADAGTMLPMLFPYLEEAAVTAPPLQDAAQAILAQLHQCWKIGQDSGLRFGWNFVHITDTVLLFPVCPHLSLFKFCFLLPSFP